MTKFKRGIFMSLKVLKKKRDQVFLQVNINIYDIITHTNTVL